jgi:hypothetical protein
MITSGAWRVVCEKKAKQNEVAYGNLLWSNIIYERGIELTGERGIGAA